MVKRHKNGEPYIGSVSALHHNPVEKTGNIIVHHPVKPEVNLWGTLKSDIDPEEYCVECERSTMEGHYDTCPTRVGIL